MPYLPHGVIKIGTAARLLNKPITTVRYMVDAGKLGPVTVAPSGHRYLNEAAVVAVALGRSVDIGFDPAPLPNSEFVQ